MNALQLASEFKTIPTLSDFTYFIESQLIMNGGEITMDSPIYKKYLLLIISYNKFLGKSKFIRESNVQFWDAFLYFHNLKEE